MSNIPLVGLLDQYQTIKPEIDAAIEQVIAATAFVGGEQVQSFETEFANYCEAKSCVCVANGTDAFYLSLRALGIGRDDEVITVSHTFIATAEAISLTGATPVFVDIDEDTMLMDPALIEAAITSTTKAIIPVHLYGQMCDMDAIMEIARRHNLKVVEDAAQAHGARWRGKRAGSIGDVGSFSFYPGKNLGAFGDAGGIVSQDEELIKRIRLIANHGSFDKYTHLTEGVNSRLDNLHAAILKEKLRHLESWNESRRSHDAFYKENFVDCELPSQSVAEEALPVWHLFVVRVTDQEGIRKRLADQGVATGGHYPLPLHEQPAYKHLGIPRGSLPITEKVAREVVSLPMYAELSRTQLQTVVNALANYRAEVAVNLVVLRQVLLK